LNLQLQHTGNIPFGHYVLSFARCGSWIWYLSDRKHYQLYIWHGIWFCLCDFLL